MFCSFTKSFYFKFVSRVFTISYRNFTIRITLKSLTVNSNIFYFDIFLSQLSCLMLLKYFLVLYILNNFGQYTGNFEYFVTRSFILFKSYGKCQYFFFSHAIDLVSFSLQNYNPTSVDCRSNISLVFKDFAVSFGSVSGVHYPMTLRPEWRSLLVQFSKSLAFQLGSNSCMHSFEMKFKITYKNIGLYSKYPALCSFQLLQIFFVPPIGKLKLNYLIPLHTFAVSPAFKTKQWDTEREKQNQGSWPILGYQSTTCQRCFLSLRAQAPVDFHCIEVSDHIAKGLLGRA